MGECFIDIDEREADPAYGYKCGAEVSNAARRHSFSVSPPVSSGMQDKGEGEEQKEEEESRQPGEEEEEEEKEEQKEEEEKQEEQNEEQKEEEEPSKRIAVTAKPALRNSSRRACTPEAILAALEAGTWHKLEAMVARGGDLDARVQYSHDGGPDEGFTAAHIMCKKAGFEVSDAIPDRYATALAKLVAMKVLPTSVLYPC